MITKKSYEGYDGVITSQARLFTSGHNGSGHPLSSESSEVQFTYTRNR